MNEMDQIIVQYTPLIVIDQVIYFIEKEIDSLNRDMDTEADAKELVLQRMNNHCLKIKQTIQGRR